MRFLTDACAKPCSQPLLCGPRTRLDKGCWICKQGTTLLARYRTRKRNDEPFLTKPDGAGIREEALERGNGKIDA